MLLLQLKNCQWDVCTGRRCSAKESVFGSFPNFCCPERRWGFCRISHPGWVKLCVELSYAPNKNSFCYNTKQSDSDVLVILEFWEMRSTPSFPLLPVPLWLWVAVSDRVQSIGQIELTFKLCTNKWLMLNLIFRNKTVWSFICTNKWLMFTSDCYIAMLEIIWQCANKYLKPFNYVQKNELRLV